MATVDLGKIRFNWTGAYNNSTAYVANDVVSSGGNSYICKLASTGNAVSNGTYWDLMSQAGTNGSNGTNGTDLGTVLTTQGDVAYRDGSGLQRLAKGTASQQLRMNSGANAPEWFTAGSTGPHTVIASGQFTNTIFDITSITQDFYITFKAVNRTSSLWGWAMYWYVSSDNGSSWLSSSYRGHNQIGRTGSGETSLGSNSSMTSGNPGAYTGARLQTWCCQGMSEAGVRTCISGQTTHSATSHSDNGYVHSYVDHATPAQHNAMRFQWNGVGPTPTFDYVMYTI
jgi:hypothetical protein